MSHVLALDQGTTSSRAIVFDAAGQVQALAQREFRQIFPRPGWVEHDPEEIWESQLAVAREALAALPRGAVAALGITNQRETTLVWERDSGRPVANAIVWQDRRTAGICERLRAAGLEPLFRERTGLVLDPYFSGTKLEWLLTQGGVAVRPRLAFGTVDSWLLWKLTGGAVHATDVSNASRTLLWNLGTGAWDDELLAALDVPRAMLPAVRASAEVYGTTQPGLLPERLPIASVAGDQQAALYGQGCVRPGMAKNTYGTGCFLLMNTGGRPIHSARGLLATAAWRVGERTDFALEGSIFIAGAVVQWLRDGLGVIRSAAEIEALAASVPDCGGVVLVPAFAGLGAPHWDPHARGTLLGVTRGTTAAHLARAALDAIACQTADVLAAMEADAGIHLAELRVDGGATANGLLMQIQADLLGVPVVRPRNRETTALGAALLAGRATAVWGDPAGDEDPAASARIDRIFEPALPRADAERILVRWRRAVERAKGWEEAG